MTTPERDSCAAQLVGLALLLPMAFLRAWAMWQLWVWFAVPIGLPAIAPHTAGGLSLLFAYLLPQRTAEPESMATTIAKGLLVPVFVVGIGWALKTVLP